MEKYLPVTKDLIELNCITEADISPNFLYKNEAGEEGNQKRNWLSVRSEFPEIYVSQIIDMIYPHFYAVCFSKKNDDSSMWGNYADNHKGVCLIYEDDQLSADSTSRVKWQEPKAVNYGGEPIERNFFESLGQLTYPQVEGWLTGADGSFSECYTHMVENEEKWRDEYWKGFQAKAYRKDVSWEHEEEYRIIISDTFHSFNDKKARELKYDSTALKGVIFGIETSEFDKKSIIDALQQGGYKDVEYHQADYWDRKILIRRKNIWDSIDMKLLTQKDITMQSFESGDHNNGI